MKFKNKPTIVRDIPNNAGNKNRNVTNLTK